MVTLTVYSGNILKVEPIEFADGLDVRCERKTRGKNDSQVLV